MFELCEQFLIQEIQCIPVIFGVYLVFSFTKDLLFKE